MESVRDTLSINWAGQRLGLHSDKAVYWRAADTLIVADTHFGKAAAFRSHGVPVPSGTTAKDIQRLSALVQRTRAQRLLVLGDFFHAKAGRAPEMLGHLDQWRAGHSQLHIIVVRGNHDQHAGDPPEHWNIHCMNEPCTEGPFAFYHDCDAAAKPNGHAGAHFVMAGHVHPCAVLHDSGGATMRAPCFLFGAHRAILPAFGSFTGMHPIRPRGGNPAERVFAVGPGAIVEVRIQRDRVEGGEPVRR